MRAWHKNHVNPDTYRFEERRDSWRGSDRFVGAALRGRPSTGKTHVGRGRVYAEGRPRSAAPTESYAPGEVKGCAVLFFRCGLFLTFTAKRINDPQ